MSESINVTVHIKVRVDPEGLLQIVEGVKDNDLGLHMMNTLFSKTHVQSGGFRGMTMDADINQLATGA